MSSRANRRDIEPYRILLLINQSLVDDPGAVQIEIQLGTYSTTFHVRADARSAPLLIGKSGRNARAIRTVMAAVGDKGGWHYHVTHRR
jgi:predicted RNA-binding protein YlqC (UPF0109 family)